MEVFSTDVDLGLAETQCSMIVYSILIINQVGLASMFINSSIEFLLENSHFRKLNDGDSIFIDFLLNSYQKSTILGPRLAKPPFSLIFY